MSLKLLNIESHYNMITPFSIIILFFQMDTLKTITIKLLLNGQGSNSNCESLERTFLFNFVLFVFVEILWNY